MSTADTHGFYIDTIIDDLETPLSAYLKIKEVYPYAFLFESVEDGDHFGRYSIITLDPDLIWQAYGEKAQIGRLNIHGEMIFTDEKKQTLDSLKDLIEAHKCPLPASLPPMMMGLFGVFGYDLIRLYEPLGPSKSDPKNLPDAVLVRPQIIMIFDNIKHEIMIICPLWDKKTDVSTKSDQDCEAAARRKIADLIDNLKASPIKPAANLIEQKVEFSSKIDASLFGDMVDKAKAYIQAGDIFQVVLSHRFIAPYSQNPFGFYRALRRLNPSPYLFYLNFDTFQLAGSSPEILIRVRDGKITLRPIAGTRPRGETPEKDLILEQELLNDPKERSEHLMLLDLGRNDVGRVAKPTTVRVASSFKIERYSHVLHIVSTVEGDAPENLNPIDALLCALPAGTLSGAPKVRAMEIIDELEENKRGVGYAGGVGYISANGNIDFCIVLRTALFAKGEITVQAGAGIVADSVAQSEYEETCHKAGALFKAANEAWRFS